MSLLSLSTQSHDNLSWLWEADSGPMVFKSGSTGAPLGSTWESKKSQMNSAFLPQLQPAKL